jgi:lysophospholipase L1-like esterase
MKTNSALVADDGLHPSALEYAQWVALLAPQVAAVLK